MSETKAVQAVPLTFLAEGQEGEIIELRGGRGMTQRLTEMGFTPSTKVKVVVSNPGGTVLIGVRDTKIALGRGIAMKIMVKIEG